MKTLRNAIVFVILTISDHVTTVNSFHNNVKYLESSITSRMSRRDDSTHVSKTGKHTYATWKNKSPEHYDDTDYNQYDASTYDDDVYQSIPAVNWLSKIYNNIFFYGIDQTVTSRKHKGRIPQNVPKSLFFTRSELVGQKILENEKQYATTPQYDDSDDDRQSRAYRQPPSSSSSSSRPKMRKINPRLPVKKSNSNLELESPERTSNRMKKNTSKFSEYSAPSTKAEYEERIEFLQEDLDILDVTITELELKLKSYELETHSQNKGSDNNDMKIQSESEDMNRLQAQLNRFYKKKEQLEEELNDIQVAYVDYLMTSATVSAEKDANSIE